MYIAVYLIIDFITGTLKEMLPQSKAPLKRTTIYGGLFLSLKLWFKLLLVRLRAGEKFAVYNKFIKKRNLSNKCAKLVKIQTFCSCKTFPRSTLCVCYSSVVIECPPMHVLFSDSHSTDVKSLWFTFDAVHATDFSLGTSPSLLFEVRTQERKESEMR